MCRCIQILVIFCGNLLVIACAPLTYTYDGANYPTSDEALKAIHADLAINVSHIEPAGSPVGGRALLIVPDRTTLRAKGVVTSGSRNSDQANYIVDFLDASWEAQIEAFRKWGMFDFVTVRRYDPDGDPDLGPHDYLIWYKVKTSDAGQWYFKSKASPQRQPVFYEKPTNRRHEYARQLAAVGKLAVKARESSNRTELSLSQNEVESETEKPVEIRVLEKRIFDTGIKTSLSLRLVVGSIKEEAELRHILNREFEKARAMRGFKHRDQLNQMFFYLYESEAARRNSGANWLAMLSWNSYDGKIKSPSISIKAAKLTDLRSTQPKRSHISRKETPTNSVNMADPSLAYKLASIDAGYRVPDDSISVARFRSLLGQLADKYVENEVMIGDTTVTAMKFLRENGISEKMLNIMEGLNSIFSEPMENQKYAEYVSIYVTLRSKGQSHFKAISGVRALLRVLGVN